MFCKIIYPTKKSIPATGMLKTKATESRTPSLRLQRYAIF